MSLLLAACSPDEPARPGAASTPTVVTTTADPAAELDAWCRAASTTTLGTVRAPGLTEISGVVAGRRDPSIVWAHNDSGDGAVLHALGTDGAPLATVRIAGVTATDWEDIAIGPGPLDASPWLHVADIGDNPRVRRSVQVVRFAEPALSGDGTTMTVTGEVVEVVHPDGPHDAEAFFVHPVSGDWYVLTKETTRSSVLFRAPRPGPDVRRVVLEAVGHLDVRPDRITAADLSPDGARLAVRTYLALRVFAVTADDVAGALGGEPCRRSIADEWQGESVAFAADGRSVITVSEGVDPSLHRTG